MTFNSELSGQVITTILKQLRLLDDETQAFTAGLSVLCNSVGACRGLLWLIRSDRLVVTAQHPRQQDNSNWKSSLDRKTSQQVVMGFLSEFGELTDTDASPVYLCGHDSKTLSGIMSATKDRSEQVVVPLRSKGMFLGILALHFDRLPCWTDDERLVVQEISDLLSMVIYQCTQIARMRTDAEDLRLLDSIRKSLSLHTAASKSDIAADFARAIARRLRFRHAALFLLSDDGHFLASNEQSPVSLSDLDNPIAVAFLSKKLKRITGHKIGDSVVDGYLLPLVAQEESRGVLLLGAGEFSDSLDDPYDRELALRLTVELSRALIANNKSQAIQRSIT